MTADNTAELALENRSSIEVDRNAKGEIAWKIKIYFPDGGRGEALNTLEHIKDELNRRFLPQPIDLEKELTKSVEAVKTLREGARLK